MTRLFSGSIRRSRVLLLLGLCPVLTALGQISAQPSSPDVKYKLSGTVINSVTGEPIRRALVQINTGSQPVALTDGSGQFEFEGLSPGTTSIDVRKPGFFEEQSQRSPPQVVTIGPDTKPVSLKLIPESVIYGHVQTPNGEPIEHLPVKVVAVRIVEGKKRWELAGSVPTNEDGEFRIANLQAGSYYIEAGPSWRFIDPMPSRRHPEGYPAMFYGGGSDLNSATPLDLGPGQQLKADFSLQTATLFKVSGTISGLAHNQGVNLQFEDRMGDRFSFPTKFDRVTGDFQTAAPAGFYKLTANAWGRDGISFNAEVPLNISSDVLGVRLMLSTSLVIPIIVRTEATRPIPAVAHRNQSASVTFPNIHLRATTNVLSPSEVWARPEGPNNRALALRDVPTGKYSLEVDPNGPWYVQSAQCADTDLLREHLVVTAGVQTPPIELVLRDDGATISGKVAASQSRRPALIILLPEHSSGSRTRTAFASPEGDFTVQNLAPADYSVFAFDYSDELEYANPDVLERYLAGAVHVSLLPNEEHTVNLDLIHVGN